MVAESTPYPLHGSVFESDIDIWVLLPLIKDCILFFCRIAVLPEILVLDEEIPILGFILVLYEILENLTLIRYVVDHVIIHQIVFLSEIHYILPITECRIDLLICDWRKSTICGRWEERQDMKPSNRTFVITGKEIIQIMEILSYAVRIGDQHYLVCNFLLH